MKCQILFSRKNKKNIINLLSAENGQRVVKVKVCLFVLRFYGPVNPMGVMSSPVSLPNHTFTGQA